MTKKRKDIELHGSIWMTISGKNLGGIGRMTLLANIDRLGSITKAAKNMKMSYKAAWDTTDLMNNLAGEPLVERSTGGKGGGGTKLTPRGIQLVQNFRLIEQEHQKFINHLSSQSKTLADDFLLIGRMGMKTSARNQFFGKITHLKEGAVNDEVIIEIAGGQEITAIITRESTKELELRKGTELWALVKASSVILTTGKTKIHFSARNCLSGVISRIQPGAVNTEVVLSLPGGGTIAATITNESRKNMQLKGGKELSAIFKASSVILGIPT